MDQRALRGRAVPAVVLGMLCAALFPGCAALSRASETASGVQATRDSTLPVLSADGRWVAFRSPADNLVPGDTNGASDVFVRDNWTKAVTRVSVSTGGVQGVGGTSASNLSISDDGRVVAFTYYADDLTTNDSNGELDVFWHDRDTDQDGVFDEPGAIATVLASARPDGSSGNEFSAAPALNADGSVLAFHSWASDLLAAPDHDTNDVPDVFASTFDLATGQRTGTRIVSRQPGSPTVEANDESLSPSIDASGNIIAFETSATNLITLGENNVEVVVRDGVEIRRATGTVQADSHTFNAALSRDGTHVAYTSFATNLVPGDTVANSEVFVTDYAGSGVTQRASEVGPASFGPETGGAPWYAGPASISADGSRVAYASNHPDLLSGDMNGVTDVFVHDFNSGITQRVSTNVVLQEGALGTDVFSYPEALSADGRFVAFATRSNLLAPDANGSVVDVFVRGAMVPVIDSVVAIDPVTREEMPPVLHPGVNELLIAGGAFGEDVGVHLGKGITATITTARVRHLLVSVNVAPGTAAGTRNLVVQNAGAVGALAPGTFQSCSACVTIAN